MVHLSRLSLSAPTTLAVAAEAPEGGGAAPAPELWALAHAGEGPARGRWLLRIGLAVLILAAAYVVFVRVEEQAWLFHPAPYPGGDWSVARIYHAQDVWIPVSGPGTQGRVHGWYVAAPEAQRTVLFFHGRQGNISDQQERLMRLRDLGSNVVLVDYPGYGKSPGVPRLKALPAIAEAAYQYVHQTLKVPDGKLIVHGDELGAALAAEVARTHPGVAGLVLESPFPDLRALANATLPMAGYFLGNGLETAAAVAAYRGPKLILYGDADPGISAATSQRVVQAAQGTVMSHVVAGGTQSDLPYQAGQQYHDWLQSFYEATGTAVKATPAPQPVFHL